MEGQEKEKPKRKRSAAKTLEIIERGHRILELRKNRASFRRISQTLIEEARKRGDDERGFSYEQVRKDYKAIIALKLEELDDAAEEHRAELSELIDDVILNYMPYVREKITDLTSDNIVQMKKKSGDVVLKAVNQQAELLGLKKPQKIEHSGPDGKPLNAPVMQVIVEFTNDIKPKDEE